MAIHILDSVSDLLGQRTLVEYVQVLLELIHDARAEDDCISQLLIENAVERCPTQRSSMARNSVRLSSNTDPLENIFQLWFSVEVAVYFTTLSLQISQLGRACPRQETTHRSVESCT